MNSDISEVEIYRHYFKNYVKLTKNLCTVDENIIGAPKMPNNFGAIKLSIFQYF